jgi:putative flippase GtrA
VIHSYFWNKSWSFDGVKGPGGFSEFFKFVMVALGSLAVNVGIATFVFHYIDPAFGLDTRVWANIGKVAGSAIGLIFSFIGFKVLVFNKKPSSAKLNAIS